MIRTNELQLHKPYRLVAWHVDPPQNNREAAQIVADDLSGLFAEGHVVADCVYGRWFVRCQAILAEAGADTEIREIEERISCCRSSYRVRLIQNQRCSCRLVKEEGRCRNTTAF